MPFEQTSPRTRVQINVTVSPDVADDLATITARTGESKAEVLSRLIRAEAARQQEGRG